MISVLFKKITFFFILILIVTFSNGVFASSRDVDLHLFTADGCPHCEDEKLFLDKIESRYSNLNIHILEVTRDEKNRKLFQETLKKLNIKSNGVPLTVVGEEYFIGFGSEETTGDLIEKAIQAEVMNDGNRANNDKIISLPVFGEIDIEKFSLPVMTIIIGGLDGFNPCAMWVLIFLISLLLGMKDRRKMWIFGGVFILTSAAVYFLFMAAWLNIFLFLGFIPWVRIIIAGVALFSGLYYLRDYYTNKEGECRVGGGDKKKRVFDKLREVVHEKNFWIALMGIIVLAMAVNLIELICSAGLPAVFTQILTLSDLASWQYYSYLLLYTFFFMLDDVVVFFLAMITLKMVGISGKYSRFSRLIGGVIMIILGILLVLRPEWLMFG